MNVVQPDSRAIATWSKSRLRAPDLVEWGQKMGSGSENGVKLWGLGMGGSGEDVIGGGKRALTPDPKA